MIEYQVNNPINGLERLHYLSRPIPINWKGYHSQLVFSYCQLMNIPFVIIDNNYLSYIPSIDPIIELTRDDIDSLDENNKQALIRISYQYDIPYYRRIWDQPISRINIIGKVVRKLVNVRILNNARTDVSNERLYTSPIFDKCWRKLSDRQIIDGEFNPEHLQSIEVSIPNVNLIFDVHPINIRKLKLLLPYSNPSYERIVIILSDLDQYESVLQSILLVRYKRELISEVINELKSGGELDDNIQFIEQICERSS